MSRTFFVDRDLGRRFPALLAAAGVETRPYHAVFSRDDVVDAEWLARCGRERWYALTHDESIGRRRRSPRAYPEVFSAGVGLIILMGHRTTADLADAFIRSRARVDAFLDSTPTPFIAKFYCSDESYASGQRKPGRIELRVAASGTGRNA